MTEQIIRTCRPVHGPCVDASTPISRDTAKRIREAGYLGVVRCFAFATAKYAEPTRDELDGILESGLGLALYAFWRAKDHSYDTGRADADRQLAMLQDLDWPGFAPVWVDLECHETPTAWRARGYAKALSLTYAANGRPLMAYYDRSFALSDAEMDGLFDVWWQSGARPELAGDVWLPKSYVMKQRPGQAKVAGHPVDLNKSYGAPFLFNVE